MFTSDMIWYVINFIRFLLNISFYMLEEYLLLYIARNRDLKTWFKYMYMYMRGGGFFFSKMFLGFWNACTQNFLGCLGCLGHPTPPPGGRAGSENDTLLPMTMTCDRFKFWSGPAWRSKVIIRKPWRRKKKKKIKKKKFWQNHKAFPAGSWECLITAVILKDQWTGC